MPQVFLQIDLSILPRNTEQISQKISHYLNILATNQNIRSLLEFHHFGTRFYQALRKNSKKSFNLKLNWNQIF